MASYESIYNGVSNSSDNPSYYTPPSAYSTAAGNLGMALDARTANQLGDLNQKLNPGQKFVEIQGIQGRTMESIPNQHLDEMSRLANLTGVDMSLHGPMVNASGVESQGGFTEENRLGAENQIKSAVLRAHRLNTKNNKNVNVTFHSSANGLPSFSPHRMIQDKDGKSQRVEDGVFIVDQTTGEIRQVRDTARFLPEEGKFKGERLDFDIQREVDKQNKDAWLQQLSRINQTSEFGQSAIDRASSDSKMNYKEILSADPDKLVDGKRKDYLKNVQGQIDYGHTYMKEAYRGVRDVFDKAWEAANRENRTEDIEKLRKFADYTTNEVTKDFEDRPENIAKLRGVVEKGLRTISSIQATPETFSTLNNFAIKKSAETFANVAQEAYNKFKDEAPVISIENGPGGEALSTGRELKQLIVESRSQLSDNLHNDGMSLGKAKKVAAQMIGATWDVGHINMMRKKGYSEQDVVAETKEIAPYVKHVHLSDNFGLDHTELPMGMGNVPLKPMIDEIKKQGFKGKEIIEAGNWWEFFSTQGGGNPFLPSLEGLDSPIYAMGGGPGWASGGVFGGYFSGQGPISPPIHHQTYGAGFQNMPVELGGEIAGDQGRFAGSPNQ
jgi:sugar phosphate isomerase/epimerase